MDGINHIKIGAKRLQITWWHYSKQL